jgi:hypothetical protein
MAKTKQGTESSTAASAERARTAQEMKELQERYDAMTRDFARQKKEFEQDMERIRLENETKEVERTLRIKAIEEKRAKARETVFRLGAATLVNECCCCLQDEALLRSIKLGVEDDAEKMKVRHKQELAALRQVRKESEQNALRCINTTR